MCVCLDTKPFPRGRGPPWPGQPPPGHPTPPPPSPRATSILLITLDHVAEIEIRRRGFTAGKNRENERKSGEKLFRLRQNRFSLSRFRADRAILGLRFPARGHRPTKNRARHKVTPFGPQKAVTALVRPSEIPHARARLSAPPPCQGGPPARLAGGPDARRSGRCRCAALRATGPLPIAG